MKQALSRKNLWEKTPRFARNACGKLLGALPPDFALGGAFRHHRRFLAEAERWPAERARAYQLERVRQICRLAYERTAYYRRAFDAVGFKPQDLCRLEDLAGLPTIDKTVVRERFSELCVCPPAAGRVDEVSTGGSSGEPLRFYIGADRSAVEYAHLVASWQRIGYDMRLAQAVLRGQVVAPDRDGLRHSYDPVLRRHYYSNFHTSDECMSRYLEHIRTIGPCFLHVYPSSVAALTRFIQRSGIEPPGNVRGILAGSENVSPQGREAAERVFGVRYFSWYGHSEKLVLAAECEQGPDYHVWPTYGHFELIGSDGHPVTRPGQEGEIVGTGFINTVMPFIRYQTGDHATYVGSRCDACGREHVIIRDIRGHRTQEMLVAEDGSLIFWTAINMHDDTFDCVRQFQFAQSVPGRATLRLVPAPGLGPDSLTRMRCNLNSKLAGQIAIDIAVVDSIPLTASGKSTFVDQRIQLTDTVREEGALA